MKYQIKFRSSALKEILALPKKMADRVGTAIDALGDNPRPFGYTQLQGSEKLFRIRIGDIRVVYTIEDEIRIVEIRMVGNRREIYRKH
jgi:mRNA interferase RelE/StbE